MRSFLISFLKIDPSLWTYRAKDRRVTLLAAGQMIVDAMELPRPSFGAQVTPHTFDDGKL